MRSILLLVAAFVAAGLAWQFLSGSSTDEPAPVVDLRPTPEATATSPDSVSGSVAPAVGNDVATPSAPSEAPRTEVIGGAADAAAVVEGRLVDADGKPRADVTVGWRSWRKGDFDVDFVGGETLGRGLMSPEGTTTTAADGRFSFAMAKGRTGRVVLPDERLLLRRGQGGFSTATGDADLGDVVALKPAVVRGIVTDDMGKPVEGITVGADTTRLGLGLAHEAKTNAQGEFAMTGLQSGTWHLRTLSPQFLPAKAEVQLEDEEHKDGVAIRLERGNAIAGQVVDDRGLPIAGAKVGCMRREKSGAMTIARFAEDEASTTDENGWFTLAGLAGETATVRATHQAHDRALAPDVVVGTGNLVLRLSRLATVRGVLEDTTGRPLVGSVVSARRTNGGNPVLEAGSDPAGNALMSDLEMDFGPLELPAGDVDLPGSPRAGDGITREDGSFEIQGVRPGPITIRARGRGHRPVERKGLQIAAAQTLEGIQLVADVGAVAVVRVVDERGEPVVGAEVELQRLAQQQDGPMQFRRAVRVEAGNDDVVHVGGLGDALGKGKTDEHGVARIAGLPSGAAEAIGSHDAFAPSRAVAATLPQQGEVELQVVLRTPGSARLTTTDANGGGVAADFVVRGPLGEPGSDAENGTTAADGSKTVDRLPPGRYEAELRKKPRGQSFGDGNSMVFVGADGEATMRSTRVAFEVMAGGVTDVALRVPMLAKVRGKVLGLAGPVADVRIGIAPRDAAAGPGGGMPDLPGLGGESVVSSAAGEYEIADLEPGTYRLTWGIAGQMVKDRTDVEIRPGETEVVRDLALRFGTVRLVVVDEKGEPIEGAEVELQEAAAAGTAQPRRQRMMMVTMNVSGDGGGSTSSMTFDSPRATSDVDGEVTIEKVPPGRYVVRVTHDRHAKKDVPDQAVVENAVTDCGRVQLQSAGRIRGRVVGADGKPSRMAMVTCRRAGEPNAEPERQPAMGGSFTFQGLAAGRYLLSAEALGPQATEPGPAVEVEVAAGATKGDVELRVAPQ